MKEINLLYVSSKPVALDAVCTEILGSFDPGAEDCVVMPYYAADIASAEKLLFEHSYSILIIEDSMEGGFDFVGTLKKDEMFMSLPVLFIGTEKSEASSELVFQSGADSLIREPFSSEDLLHFIKPLIKNKSILDGLLEKIMRLQEESIKNYILTDLIKRYIPKTVWDIANKFADEQTIHIPETEEEVTIVYGDIAGFTKASQHQNPKDVIDMLNDAYSVVNAETYKYQGDIDKFIGDAFLAVHKDAMEAIESAVKIQEEFLILNQKRANDGKTTFRFRIGVHTGRVIRGNVGSELRSDNTLIGDTVNTAARIESVTPPGEVLVSKEACQKAELTVPAGYLVREMVKGIDTPLVMYNVFRYFQERN